MSTEDPEDCISLDDALATLANDEKDEEDNEVLKIQDIKGRVSVIKDVESNEILKRPHTPSSDSSNDSQKRYKIDENEVSTEPNFIYNPDSLSNVVATHYNKIEEKGLNERTKTRIYFMRNFNNWIKTMLISEYLEKVTSNKVGVPLRVLDMCCGKGGDLFKWQKAKITHLICADIADVSVEQCKKRYDDMKSKQNDYSRFPKLFTAEFIASDCTLMRLREQYQDPSVSLDLVSCQFAFHYCFETLPQAERMLQNASECLRPGGYFIGTIPDANEIIARKEASGASSFGNEVYNIEFQFDDSNKVPLFGAKYLFQLEGVVNCPEFLVYFPALVKLAKKYGLELEKKEKFEEVFNRLSHTSNGTFMMNKMQALETYPPFPNTTLSSSENDEYGHAKSHCDKNPREKFQKIGTLSKSEWEAISLYMTFAFKKVKTEWNSEGKPTYK